MVGAVLYFGIGFIMGRKGLDPIFWTSAFDMCAGCMNMKIELKGKTKHE